MQSKRILISKRIVGYIFLLIPFFEPLIVDLLIERYPNEYIWPVIDYAYKILEMVIASCVYLIWFRKIAWRQKTVDKIDTLLIWHLLFMIISCLVQGDFAITFCGSTFCTIALILLSEYMIQKSEMDFLRTGKILFGFWSLYAIITAFLFPNGFGISTTKYDAIFGLGSKNNAFPFFFAYLFFLCAYKIKRNRSLTLYIPLIITGMIVAAIIYTSISTIICTGLAFGVYFLEKHGKQILKKQNALLWLTILAFTITMLYIGLNIRIIETILNKFGRNSTFSHRDVIWRQAISYFRNNLLLGAGASIEYQTVWTEIKTLQAHSQYLDKLAKFGMGSFMFLVLALTKLFRKIRRCNNLCQMNVLVAMVLIYMIHMAFDTYNYNFFIIILIILNSFMRQDIGLRKRENEYGN